MVFKFEKRHTVSTAALFCLLVGVPASYAGPAPTASLRPVAAPAHMRPMVDPTVKEMSEFQIFENRVVPLSFDLPTIPSRELNHIVSDLAWLSDDIALPGSAPKLNKGLNEKDPSPDAENSQEQYSAIPGLPSRMKTTAGFSEDFRDVRDALVSSMLDAASTERAARTADYAQFLLANMMLPEAISLIHDILNDFNEVDEVQMARVSGYLQIADFLMAPNTATPNAALPEMWGDDPLWSAMLSDSNTDPDGPDLRMALNRLMEQGDSIIDTVLPPLFERAMDLGEVELAADIADTAMRRSGETPTLMLMRGRIVLASGDEEMAYSLFKKASNGRGRYAAEARLEIADIAIKRGDRKLLPDVLEILKEGASTWRGDELSLKLRARLAQIAEELRDVETSIIVMTQIEEGYPGTAEAELAHERAGIVMDYLSRQINSDALGVDEAMHIVRRINPGSSGRSEWINVRLSLGNLLHSSGLTQAAEAEYEAAWADIMKHGFEKSSEDVVDRLISRHTEALLESGKVAAAAGILARRPVPSNDDLLPHYAALSIRATGEQGRAGHRLSTVYPTAEASMMHIELARLALAEGREEEALSGFSKSLGSAPDEGEADLLQGIRLSIRLQDKKELAKMKELMTSEEAVLIEPLTTGLSEDAPVISPLSRGGSKATLNGAGKTVEAARQYLDAE